MTTMNHQYDDAEIAMKATTTTITIVAPTDMPGGYEFLADAGNGASYKVRVVSFLCENEDCLCKCTMMLTRSSCAQKSAGSSSL
jgi:hypothetical protein